MTATPVLLALTSAVGYGTGDFLGGQGSRRTSPAQLSLIVQCTGLLVATAAVLITVHGRPPAHVIAWGALCGVGSALGNQALYRGLATGAMNVVAPLSAVLTAALPALVGLAGGEQLGLPGWAGLIIAAPAIALISTAPAHEPSGRPEATTNPRSRPVGLGVGWGLLAGCGFGLLFIGLDKAGTGSGAWPLLLDQTVAVILVGLVHTATHRQLTTTTHRASWSDALRWGVPAGLCGAAGNIFFFLATGSGLLTVVAVLSALYPAITVILAAVVLHEKAGASQLAGLILAALAVALITTA